MKLLTKTNKYFVATSILTSIIGCIIFYIIVKEIVHDQVDEKLIDKKLMILGYIKNHDSLSVSDLLHLSNISVTKMDRETSTNESIKDTTIFDSIENEDIQYRSIAFQALDKNNKVYLIQLSSSLLESEDLLIGIVYSSFAVIILLSISTLFINKWSSKRLWRPFYHTLKSLKNYDINKRSQFGFDETDINEFNELNNEVSLLTERIEKDYINLKEFTENAAHELQTPLAVVKAKLELLYQNENLEVEQLKLINSANEALHKLTKLNSNLLLLSKIENRQFLSNESINVKEIIASKIESFSIFASDKHICINNKIKDDLFVTMNSALAEVIFSNLFSNAIKHNIIAGCICLELNGSIFEMSNSSNSFPSNTSEMFERFKKSNETAGSTGLGLSIVKQICNLYGFTIDYFVKNKLNVIRVDFKPKVNRDA